jgi:hypothetical protein
MSVPCGLLADLKLQSVCARISELTQLGVVTKKLRSSPDDQGRWYQTRLTKSGLHGGGTGRSNHFHRIRHLLR